MKGPSFYDRDFFVIKSDYELIAESVTRIIMTNPGERPGLPFMGVGLKRRLFEPLDEITNQEIEIDIRNQIKDYEPRCDIISLNFEEVVDENALSIKIGFILKGDRIEDERFINLIFELEE